MRSDDVLTQLDPTAPDDPRFDPDGDVAKGVLSAAIARGSEPAGATTTSRPARRPRLLAGAMGTSVAAIAAVALLTGGGSTLTATQALAQAVNRTAAFESGVIRYHNEIQDDESGYRLDATQQVRFSGTDMEIVQRGGEILPSGTHERHDSTARQVDGHQWVRSDDPAGQWRLLGAVATDATPLADRVRAEVGNRALVELVKAASDVRQDGSTFRATVDANALRALPTVPFDLDQGPATAPIDVEVSLSADGTIRRLVIRTPDSSGSTHVERAVEYSDLGVAQTIVAPQE